MMHEIGSARFSYVQARLQARHSLRPSESTWRQLEASYSLEHYLQATTHTSLRPWIADLQGTPDVHSIERTLRGNWVRYVHAIAEWQPSSWQAAVRWIAVLVHLPAFAHVMQGLPEQPWILEDPELHPLARGDRSTRLEALSASGFAPLLNDSNREGDFLEAWRKHWHTLLPKTTRRIRAGIDRLEQTVDKHMHDVQQKGKLGSERPNSRLSAKLVGLFRTYAQTPVAVFSHLGMVALDLERLRAALAIRALFRHDDREAA